MLEFANTLPEETQRKEVLRFVIVGANYTGVELAGEYLAFLKNAARSYDNVSPEDIEMVLVEYGERILGTMKPESSEYVAKTLKNRGAKILTKNTVVEIGRDFARLQSGEILSTRTVVWTAGIAPNPMNSKSALPLNERGYIKCDSTLKVQGIADVWALGDAAFVPGPDGKPYAATAQNSSRQGPVAAKNIVAEIRGNNNQPFVFHVMGSFAAFGNRKAAAEIKNMRFRGFIGWFLYRSAYLVKMPTLATKVRLGIDWFFDLVLPYPPVQLGIHEPIPPPSLTPEPSPCRTQSKDKDAIS